MRRKPHIILLASALTLTLTALFFGFPSPEPLCTLPKANAQDNPCIVQDATLTSLGLQATIDGMNYRATISAFETQVSTLSGGSPSELPIREDFNNNDRGWELANRQGVLALIEDGQLKITLADNSMRVLLVPDVTVGENFYAELRLAADARGFFDGSRGGIGIWIGDVLTDRYHIFAVSEAEAARFFDGMTVIENAGSYAQYSLRAGDVIGLEAREGEFTLYYNDDVQITTTLTPYGNDIGLYIGSRGAGSVFIDTFLLRETR
jgi:hypothetical protein